MNLFGAPGGHFPHPTWAASVFGSCPPMSLSSHRAPTLLSHHPVLGSSKQRLGQGFPLLGCRKGGTESSPMLGVPKHPGGSWTCGSASGRTQHGDWMDHSELKHSGKRCLFQKCVGNHKRQVKLRGCSPGQL